MLSLHVERGCIRKPQTSVERPLAIGLDWVKALIYGFDSCL